MAMLVTLFVSLQPLTSDVQSKEYNRFSGKLKLATRPTRTKPMIFRFSGDSQACEHRYISGYRSTPPLASDIFGGDK